MPLGRLAEALQQTELALTEDPLNPFFRIGVGMYEICRGNEERGEAFLRQVLDLNDRMYVPHLWLCGLALRRGHLGQVLAQAERAYAIEPRNPLVVGTLAGALERNGEGAQAERLREQLGTRPMPAVRRLGLWAITSSVATSIRRPSGSHRPSPNTVSSPPGFFRECSATS